MFHRKYLNALPRNRNAIICNINVFRVQTVSNDVRFSNVYKCFGRLDLRSVSECLHYLRSRSVNIYRSFDNRLRRTHRFFTDFYAKNHSSRARVAFGRYGRTGVLVSAAGVYNNTRNDSDPGTFHYNRKNISDQQLRESLREFCLVDKLIESLVCQNCKKRVVINYKKENVKYCTCKTSNIPSTKELGWEPYMETEEIIIWRQEYMGLYIYKVYGKQSDVKATDLLAVHTDCEYRRQWDPTLVKVDTLESRLEKSGRGHIIHWVVEWPSFFSDRDYVFERRYRLFSANETSRTHSCPSSAYHRPRPKETIVIISRSCQHPDRPEGDRAVRVHEYWSNIIIRPFGDINEKGAEFSLTYFDSAGLGAGGGAAGAAAATWAAGRGVPSFFKRMHQAARDYNYWKDKHGAGHPEGLPPIPGAPEISGKEEVSSQLNKESTLESEEDKSAEALESKRAQKKDKSPNRSKEDKKPTKTEVADSETKKNTKRNTSEHQKRELETETSKPRQTAAKDTSAASETKDPINHQLESADGHDEVNRTRWWRYLYPFHYFA